MLLIHITSLVDGVYFSPTVIWYSYRPVCLSGRTLYSSMAHWLQLDGVRGWDTSRVQCRCPTNGKDQWMESLPGSLWVGGARRREMLHALANDLNERVLPWVGQLPVSPLASVIHPIPSSCAGNDYVGTLLGMAEVCTHTECILLVCCIRWVRIS